MEPDWQMFCPRASLVISRKIETTHVVLKSTTFDLGGGTMNGQAVWVQIFKELNKSYDFSEGRRKSNIFSFSGTDAVMDWILDFQRIGQPA